MCIEKRKMSILGIDYGEKRIGIAVSDKLFITAQNLGFIPNESFEQVLDKIKSLMQENDINKLVIGLPIKMDGTDSAQTQKVREFTEKLKDKIDIEIVFSDERMTTAFAQNLLISSGMRRKKRKTKVDGIAAQILLQGYMDANK